MKLLFDENLSFKLCDRLSDLFPGSSHVRLQGLAEASDGAIWDHARKNGFILVSLDADFAERAAVIGLPPKVLWLRCGNQPTDAVERLLRTHFEAISEFSRDLGSCLEIY
jgi:predicted nuclease of predicted toxin-antitoxin system